MKTHARGAVRPVILLTLALVGVAAFAPGRFELALRIYALLLAGVVVGVALLTLDRTLPRETRLDVRRPRSRSSDRPPSLGRVENEVVLGIASSVDLHYRLVPRLRRVAEGLLSSRRNLTLGDERARDVLGDETWELVRPDRVPPEDRLGGGMHARDLERVLDALERV